MNIVICGSRNFVNYGMFKAEMDSFLSAYEHKDIVLISGGANGADTLARDYAAAKDIEFHEILAQWDKEGKKAGIMRNLQMLEVANHVVAFWDGKSRGTKHMVEQCLSRDIPITVFEV